MTETAAEADRLSALVDRWSRRAVGFCSGPGPAGECPSLVAGQPLPCEGKRVVPMRQTLANGLPFLVDPRESDRCPMAWVDSFALDEASPALVSPE